MGRGFGRGSRSSTQVWIIAQTRARKGTAVIKNTYKTRKRYSKSILWVFM